MPTILSPAGRQATPLNLPYDIPGLIRDEQCVGPVKRHADRPASDLFVAPSESIGELLPATDEIYVTADSVAMVSDAIATGKPVGLIPIERSGLGRVYIGLMDRLWPGHPVRPRDMRFFWRELERRKLARPLDQQSAGDTRNLAAVVAAQVSSILFNHAEFRNQVAS